jgi:hypothetical protein
MGTTQSIKEDGSYKFDEDAFVKIETWKNNTISEISYFKKSDNKLVKTTKYSNGIKTSCTQENDNGLRRVDTFMEGKEILSTYSFKGKLFMTHTHNKGAKDTLFFFDGDTTICSSDDLLLEDICIRTYW